MTRKPTYEELEQRVHELEREQARLRISESNSKKSETYLRALIRTLPDLVWLKDLEGVYLFCNSRFEAFFGAPIDEVVGKTDYDFVDKQLADFFRAHDRRALECGGPSRNEEEVVFASDGHHEILETIKTPIRGSDGEILGVLGIGRDVTERKNAEREIKAQKELFELFLDTATDAIVIVDDHLRVVALSSSALAYQPPGTKKSDIVGRTLESLREQMHGKLEPEQFWRVLATGEPLVAEDCCVIHGEERQTQVRAFKMGPGLAAIMADVTAQRAAETEVRRTRARLQSFMDSATDIIMVFDARLEILDINKQGLSFFPGKVSKESLTTKDVIDWFEAIQGGAILRRARELVTTGHPDIAEDRVSIDGNPRWLSTRLFPVGDGVGLLINDVTENKMIEEELRHSQKIDSIGRLAGGIAHDFNNMLEIIIGYADLAMDELCPQHAARGHLGEILHAAQRSSELTRQLLAFARRQPVALRTLNLNETLESMLKMLRSLIGEHIELVWRPGAELWSVRMDPTQVGQILTNLCVNARDAISDVGRVVIETQNIELDDDYCIYHRDSRPGEFVMLSVEDNGRGIDSRTKEMLFEPFFTTKGVGKGTGLGLSTVYGIVRQNRGFISVQSEQGEGSVFRLFLPRQVGASESKPCEGRSTVVPRGNETVLVVEDEAAILAMVSMMLEKVGYSVLAASDPEEAIRIAEGRAGQIQLLLSDVIMPSMNGRVLADRVIAVHPETKVLLMSGYTDDVIGRQGVLEGDYEVIQKPFSTRTLTAKVREVLSKKSAEGV